MRTPQRLNLFKGAHLWTKVQQPLLSTTHEQQTAIPTHTKH